jgi:hypothetical protein
MLAACKGINTGKPAPAHTGIPSGRSSWSRETSHQGCACGGAGEGGPPEGKCDGVRHGDVDVGLEAGDGRPTTTRVWRRPAAAWGQSLTCRHRSNTALSRACRDGMQPGNSVPRLTQHGGYRRREAIHRPRPPVSWSSHPSRRPGLVLFFSADLGIRWHLISV